VDLYLAVESPAPAGSHQEHFIGEISPGEPFGVSALLEPSSYGLTARAAAASRLAWFDAAGLRALAADDPAFASHLFREAARLATQRLRDTRVQLAAAWA
jgi:CRP-like cAMP-binding protein